MAVLFQDRFIYMPYMPPFARSEKVEDYTKDCLPVQWSQVSIRSLDRTKISLCIDKLIKKHSLLASRKTIVCYFQGNGSSTPPRLPLLSNTLKAIAQQCDEEQDIELVALSYRGYWTSSGRASEVGIRKDSKAMLQWVQKQYGDDIRIILWGQSIGAGVACATAAESSLPIQGLILETPFTSIKSMLVSLYPQRWLPYQYLWPFLWNHWDNQAALKQIAARAYQPDVLLLTARRDEVVPREEAAKIEQLLTELQYSYERVDILGALHTEATTRREGQQAVAIWIGQLIQHNKPTQHEQNNIPAAKRVHDDF